MIFRFQLKSSNGYREGNGHHQQQGKWLPYRQISKILNFPSHMAAIQVLLQFPPEDVVLWAAVPELHLFNLHYSPLRQFSFDFT